jgi:hypothetical protein
MSIFLRSFFSKLCISDLLLTWYNENSNCPVIQFPVVEILPTPPGAYSLFLSPTALDALPGYPGQAQIEARTKPGLTRGHQRLRVLIKGLSIEIYGDTKQHQTLTYLCEDELLIFFSSPIQLGRKKMQRQQFQRHFKKLTS